MIKKIILGLSLILIAPGISWAQNWEIGLGAGIGSAVADVHYRNYVDTGFLKIGGNALYTNDEDESYKLGSINFTVGSDTLTPGLTLEVGLRAILGSAEDGNRSGDVGAIGFTGYGEYVFSRDIIPIPIEVFSRITWAPDSLSFRDEENYLEFTLGSGVRIGRYASVRLCYTVLNIDMKTGSQEWSIDDGRIYLGLAMRF